MAFPMILIIFFFFSSILTTIVANPRTEVVARICRGSLEKNITVFAQNYARAVNLLAEKVTRSGFGFATVGKLTHKIYAMTQCLGDLSVSDCTICFAKIQYLLQGCFPSAGGRVYLDGCYLRMEKYNFYDESTNPHDKTVCGPSTSKMPKFEDMALQVVGDLIEKAPKKEGYASGSISSTNGSVFALANCWRSLSEDLCTSCLRDAAKNTLFCLPASEARALNAGCFLRYSDKDFINDESWSDDTLLIALIISVTVLFVFSSAAIFIGVFLGKCVYEKFNKDPGKLEGIDMDSSLIKRSLQFKYSTLEKATDSFSESNKLGQGGYGEVFKGTLEDGREIAIKRMFINAKRRGVQVYNEINIISRAQHKNLVRFLGCSFNPRESLLVYEFLFHRSLDLMLSGPEKKAGLTWKKRFGIILGIAEGLEYLHKGCEVKIIHRDIKASNILLDMRLRPKIADFGLARFFSEEKDHVSIAIAGTLGYMAPEYIGLGQLTEKVDVYSYGVLVLEILCGRTNNQFDPQGSLDTIVTTVWKHFQLNRLMDIIDKSMEMNDVGEATRVAEIGLLCTQECPSLRPSMTKIIQMLKRKEVRIPAPSKPPFVDEFMTISNVSESSHTPLHPAISSTYYNDLDPR